MAAISLQWLTAQWLLQGFITSLLSGVGFLFITLALEYVKKYCRSKKEHDRAVLLQKLLSGEEIIDWSNDRALVPVPKGRTLGRGSVLPQSSLLFNAFKQYGGYLGVGKGYYSKKNEFCRVSSIGEPSHKFLDGRAKQDNLEPPEWSNLHLSSLEKVNADFQKAMGFGDFDTKDVCENAMSQAGSALLKRFRRSNTGARHASDIKLWSQESSTSSSKNGGSQADKSRKICQDLCRRIVSEHPFIAPFLKRGLLEDDFDEVSSASTMNSTGFISSKAGCQQVSSQSANDSLSGCSELNWCRDKQVKPKVFSSKRSLTRGGTVPSRNKTPSILPRQQPKRSKYMSPWIQKRNSDSPSNSCLKLSQNRSFQTGMKIVSKAQNREKEKSDEQISSGRNEGFKRSRSLSVNSKEERKRRGAGERVNRKTKNNDKLSLDINTEPSQTERTNESDVESKFKALVEEFGSSVDSQVPSAQFPVIPKKALKRATSVAGEGIRVNRRSVSKENANEKLSLELESVPATSGELAQKNRVRKKTDHAMKRCKFLCSRKFRRASFPSTKLPGNKIRKKQLCKANSMSPKQSFSSDGQGLKTDHCVKVLSSLNLSPKAIPKTKGSTACHSNCSSRAQTCIDLKNNETNKVMKCNEIKAAVKTNGINDVVDNNKTQEDLKVNETKKVSKAIETTNAAKNNEVTSKEIKINKTNNVVKAKFNDTNSPRTAVPVSNVEKSTGAKPKRKILSRQCVGHTKDSRKAMQTSTPRNVKKRSQSLNPCYERNEKHLAQERNDSECVYESAFRPKEVSNTSEPSQQSLNSRTPDRTTDGEQEKNFNSMISTEDKQESEYITPKSIRDYNAKVSKRVVDDALFHIISYHPKPVKPKKKKLNKKTSLTQERKLHAPSSKIRSSDKDRTGAGLAEKHILKAHEAKTHSVKKTNTFKEKKDTPMKKSKEIDKGSQRKNNKLSGLIPKNLKSPWSPNKRNSPPVCKPEIHIGKTTYSPLLTKNPDRKEVAMKGISLKNEAEIRKLPPVDDQFRVMGLPSPISQYSDSTENSSKCEENTSQFLMSMQSYQEVQQVTSEARVYSNPEEVTLAFKSSPSPVGLLFQKNRRSSSASRSSPEPMPIVVAEDITTFQNWEQSDPNFVVLKKSVLDEVVKSMQTQPSQTQHSLKPCQLSPPSKKSPRSDSLKSGKTTPRHGFSKDIASGAHIGESSPFFDERAFPKGNQRADRSPRRASSRPAKAKSGEPSPGRHFTKNMGFALPIFGKSPQFSDREALTMGNQGDTRSPRRASPQSATTKSREPSPGPHFTKNMGFALPIFGKSPQFSDREALTMGNQGDTRSPRRASPQSATTKSCEPSPGPHFTKNIGPGLPEYGKSPQFYDCQVSIMEKKVPHLSQRMAGASPTLYTASRRNEDVIQTPGKLSKGAISRSPPKGALEKSRDSKDKVLIGKADFRSIPPSGIALRRENAFTPKMKKGGMDATSHRGNNNKNMANARSPGNNLVQNALNLQPTRPKTEVQRKPEGKKQIRENKDVQNIVEPVETSRSIIKPPESPNFSARGSYIEDTQIPNNYPKAKTHLQEGNRSPPMSDCSTSPFPSPKDDGSSLVQELPAKSQGLPIHRGINCRPPRRKKGNIYSAGFCSRLDWSPELSPPCQLIDVHEQRNNLKRTSPVSGDGVWTTKSSLQTKNSPPPSSSPRSPLTSNSRHIFGSQVSFKVDSFRTAGLNAKEGSAKEQHFNVDSMEGKVFTNYRTVVTE